MHKRALARAHTQNVVCLHVCWSDSSALWHALFASYAQARTHTQRTHTHARTENVVCLHVCQPDFGAMACTTCFICTSARTHTHTHMHAT